jgi:hypothetical protein
VPRQERHQVLGHADRPDAGATAAVRDAEGLVEVEVAHVGAEAPRPGQPDHRVEVGAVDVDLPAGVVHRRADLLHLGLEHPVRRGVGQHDRGEPLGVLLDLRPQVGQVDVAGLVAGHDDHAQTGHDGAGGVGAVRRARDQADVALVVAAEAVVAVDGQEPCELALRAGVGLHAHGRVAGDLGQVGAQLVDQLPVAAGLLGRGERVQVGELRPGDRGHLDRRVELHGARAQRDHRAVQREVLVGQRAQVAHQLGLGPVDGEDRVGEERRRAAQLRR